jgi:hypothetical protein
MAIMDFASACTRPVRRKRIRKARFPKGSWSRARTDHDLMWPWFQSAVKWLPSLPVSASARFFQ